MSIKKHIKNNQHDPIVNSNYVLTASWDPQEIVQKSQNYDGYVRYGNPKRSKPTPPGGSQGNPRAPGGLGAVIIGKNEKLSKCINSNRC